MNKKITPDDLDDCKVYEWSTISKHLYDDCTSITEMISRNNEEVKHLKEIKETLEKYKIRYDLQPSGDGGPISIIGFTLYPKLTDEQGTPIDKHNLITHLETLGFAEEEVFE